MAISNMLIDYIPPYLQDYLEIQAIMNSEQEEHRSVWNSVNDVWKNQFLDECTEEGVSRWEKSLQILPKATDTLEERKFKILALWNQERPYTMTKLHEVLTSLCGVDQFSIDLDENNYTITIKLAITSANNYDEVEKLLIKMIPANMIGLITIKYNTHLVLSAFTHSALSAFTHDQLRSEDMN